MSYKVFIKKDYKPRVLWLPDTPWYIRRKKAIGALLCLGTASLLVAMSNSGHEQPGPITDAYIPTGIADNITLPVPALAPEPGPLTDEPMVYQPAQNDVEPEPTPWQSHRVATGENLSIIFDRRGLSPRVLYEVMNSGDEAVLLKKLIPGNEILFDIRGNELHALRYEPDLITTLDIVYEDGSYKSDITVIELDTEIRQVEGVIKDSLFLAGQSAGLSDNIIMRLVALYGWDIDFALNIRSGDSFKVVFEERFKSGQKVNDGPIIAAEFINRKKVYRAVRYTTPDGETDYYNEEGFSMRKAFLRTPVNFSRISSRFSLNRNHPVLNRIRAHKGVDYAAPAGTPIKATGDGTISFIGTNGGYGRMITIRHGGIYTTAYAHMARYVGGMKTGKKVRQGDIIGYVGSSGLATGPHLHYEFRVNGVHRNPLTVKFPKAEGIPEKLLAHFKLQTQPLLAKLDTSMEKDFASGHQPVNHKLSVALDTTIQDHKSIR